MTCVNGIMKSPTVILRCSLLACLFACGSLVCTGQNRAADSKQQSRYPLVTCEELKKLIDAKATQDFVIVDSQPAEYFAEATSSPRRHYPGSGTPFLRAL